MENTKRLDFKQIWLDELNEQIIKDLQKAIDVSYYGHSLKDIIQEIAELRIQLWRGVGTNAHFVLLTRLNVYPAGIELNIWSLGGKGYIKYIDNIYDHLEDFAKKEGAKWISGYIDRRGFKRLYERFEPLKTYNLWIKELDDVPTE